MMSGGILVEVLAAAILPNVMSFAMLIQMAWLFTILTALAGLAMSASGIWGLIEGIIILSQGDAGLARKGYPVAEPMPMQNYGYQNGYNQQMNNGMGNMNNMNGGMNNGMGNMNNMGGNMNNDMSGNMNNNQNNNQNNSDNNDNGGDKNGKQ